MEGGTRMAVPFGRSGGALPVCDNPGAEEIVRLDRAGELAGLMNFMLFYATKLNIERRTRGNMSAQDLVHETLEKVLNGDRLWNPQTAQCFRIWILSAMRGICDNKSKLSGNRKVVNTSAGSDSDNSESDALEYLSANNQNNVIYLGQGMSPSAEEVYQVKTTAQEISHRLEKYGHIFVLLFELNYYCGLFKPQELAIHLGVTVGDINNYKKRYARILKKEFKYEK